MQRPGFEAGVGLTSGPMALILACRRRRGRSGKAL
jgi:hypothetical protein